MHCISMHSISNDIRYALRGFRRSPLFTVVAVLSLAFGIGANTAIFSLLDQVLLRLLPVKQPEQLVIVAERGLRYGSSWGDNTLSYPMYEDFRDHNRVFSGMFCSFGTSISLSAGTHTERVQAELVSGSYFPLLGVTAALGRILTPGDDRIPGGHPVAMLSYRFWQTRFSSDRSIIGKTILLNGNRMTVIGVVQPALRWCGPRFPGKDLRAGHDAGPGASAVRGRSQGAAPKLGDRVRPAEARYRHRTGSCLTSAPHARHSGAGASGTRSEPLFRI